MRGVTTLGKGQKAATKIREIFEQDQSSRTGDKIKFYHPALSRTLFELIFSPNLLSRIARIIETT